MTEKHCIYDAVQYMHHMLGDVVQNVRIIYGLTRVDDRTLSHSCFPDAHSGQAPWMIYLAGNFPARVFTICPKSKLLFVLSSSCMLSPPSRAMAFDTPPELDILRSLGPVFTMTSTYKYEHILAAVVNPDF